MLVVANAGKGPTRFKSSIQEAMVLCEFFHGIWWFIPSFEIIETNGFFILSFSKCIDGTGFMENICRQSCTYFSSLQIHNKKCFDFSIHFSYGLHSLANYVTRLKFGTMGDVSCVILLLTLDSCLFALNVVFMGPHISCHAKLNFVICNTLDNNIQ